MLPTFSARNFMGNCKIDCKMTQIARCIATDSSTQTPTHGHVANSATNLSQRTGKQCNENLFTCKFHALRGRVLDEDAHTPRCSHAKEKKSLLGETHWNLKPWDVICIKTSHKIPQLPRLHRKMSSGTNNNELLYLQTLGRSTTVNGLLSYRSLLI